MLAFLRSLPPLGIAASAIAVAQIHGAPSWIALFPSPMSWGGAGVGVLGWTVSLTWEAASVWLWWRRDRAGAAQVAKWGATAALMAGMAVQSAGPLLQAAEAAGLSRQVLTILGQQSAAGHWVSQSTLKQAAAAASPLPAQRGGAGGGVGGVPLPPWALPYAAVAVALLVPALYALGLFCVTTAGREWHGSALPLSTQVERGGPQGRGEGEAAKPAAPFEVDWDKLKAAARRPSPLGEGPAQRAEGEAPVSMLVRTAESPSPNRAANSAKPAEPAPGARSRKTVILAYAQARGLTTQRQVADSIGEPPSTLSEFANAKTEPKVTERIAAKLTATSPDADAGR